MIPPAGAGGSPSPARGLRPRDSALSGVESVPLLLVGDPRQGVAQ